MSYSKAYFRYIILITFNLNKLVKSNPKIIINNDVYEL